MNDNDISKIIERVVYHVLEDEKDQKNLNDTANTGSGGNCGGSCSNGGCSCGNKNGLGIFESMDAAIAAAQKAYKQYREYSIEQREKMIANIRRLTLEEAGTMASMGVEETGMGRVDHKMVKHQLVANKTPGTEDLHPQAFTGDAGLTLVEPAPFGVIGSITPSTNPSETVICNSIGMIAAGNAVVFCPHPSAAKVSNYAVDLVNRGILEGGGPENLIVSVKNPTLKETNAMIENKSINMLVATGGPGIVKKLLSSGKKAIGAGAGNPPVVVDETADIKKAAKDIIAGASFDNNMPCIAEKECFVTEPVREELVYYMKQNKAYEITGGQIEKLLQTVLIEKEGNLNLNKNWVGKDAVKLLKEIGITHPGDVDLIICQVEESHPFVTHELMMPILPIVGCKDVDQAIGYAVKNEHGYRHSAHMHSKNVDHLTKMARAIQTTIFVKNAPSYAGIGAGGEGHTTFTIAGPTGEGLTSARTFTRSRRCVLVDGFHII